MSVYENTVFSKHAFSHFSGEYQQLESHMCMLKDRLRATAFFKQIKKHCKDKIVVDFGAGSGILGTYALMCGAKEVWFVEEMQSLHSIIRDMVSTNHNEHYNWKVVTDVSELPQNEDYFDVCVSECLGDFGVERTMTYEYAQLVEKYPNCISIPDRLDIYWSTCYFPELDKEIEFIKDYPINLDGMKDSCFSPIRAGRFTRIDDTPVKDNGLYEMYFNKWPEGYGIQNTFDISEAVKKEPKHNYLIFYWRAFCRDEMFVHNGPDISSKNFNHWMQFGLAIEKGQSVYTGVVNHKTGPFLLYKVLDNQARIQYKDEELELIGVTK
tara:strand:+ start:50451 stop:51422 length:972 start_codon:yes stop_codon:yes gene_type:complete